MRRKEFETLVTEGFLRLPEKFRRKIKNVGFLVEDEPSEELRREVGLREDETLLGFYRGIPRVARGEEYGVGPTFPDTIFIFQKPTEEEARERIGPDAPERAFKAAVRAVAAETVWHEVGHYFGLDEEEVRRQEEKNLQP